MVAGIFKKIKDYYWKSSIRFRRWLIKDILEISNHATEVTLKSFINEQIKKERDLRNAQAKRSKEKLCDGIENANIRLLKKIEAEMNELVRKTNLSLRSFSAKIDDVVKNNMNTQFYSMKSDIENVQSLIDHHTFELDELKRLDSKYLAKVKDLERSIEHAKGLIRNNQGLVRELNDNGSGETVSGRTTTN